MSDYYEALGEVERYTPAPADGFITIPASAIEAVPYRLQNLQPEDIAYAGQNTVTRDAGTQALLIDTHDVALALPGHEWGLRVCPAVMKVAVALGSQAIDGFLVDCRRIAVFPSRDSGLTNGVESEKFQDMKENLGTSFPLGVILNDAGMVHYIGHPELHHEARSMMRRVDKFVEDKWPRIIKHEYLLPIGPDAIKPIKKQLILPQSAPKQSSEPAPRDTDQPSPRSEASDSRKVQWREAE